MTRSVSLLVLVTVMLSGCAHWASLDGRKAPPDEELAEQLYAAIWRDLQSNAQIGNGNELAAHWANAGVEGDEAPLLHVQGLVCSGGETRLDCRFGLLRDGGIAPYLGRSVPDRLTCGVRFRRSDDQWSIPRLPPGPKGGHSRITIKCQPLT